jgi:hypothetical protein
MKTRSLVFPEPEWEATAPKKAAGSGLTETIIAAAIEVHRDKGPGLIESIYEWCLLKELGLRGLVFVNQKPVLIEYKGFTREEPLRFDVLVEGCAKPVQGRDEAPTF